MFAYAIVACRSWPTTQKDTTSFEIVKEMIKNTSPNSYLSRSNESSLNPAMHTDSQPPNWIMLAAWVKRHAVVLLTRFHKYLSSRARGTSLNKYFKYFFPWALWRIVATVQSFQDLESRPLVGERSETEDKETIGSLSEKPFVV